MILESRWTAKDCESAFEIIENSAAVTIAKAWNAEMMGNGRRRNSNDRVARPVSSMQF
jgi:hypothetical protein